MISKDVFSFLKILQKNNNRDWFQEHKAAFKEVEMGVKQFYAQLFEQLNTVDSIDTFKVFRIYRDVRFSKNKLPYKIHFSGSFHRTKPELRGGYYLHLAPQNESFIATGFWDPNKEDLLRIRKEFETDSEEIRALMEAPKFKSVWGRMQGDELKSAPRGFDKLDPNIDLIRRKQFIFTKKFTDKEVLSKGFEQQVIDDFEVIRPYFDYMSSVLTTNLNGESTL
ncbi:conserved hypothetical protein (DUF24) [Formosa sp. Hel1_33_131]|uniref:DUF2461 domain-containing protein n=1 Tax=Formosa sp. Hel1_33_131 TaxID=1336794 RepID=UPI00084E35D4|nr:DUF2461 domain-containing protein [Formosa sp. Hel1_33_131]AOR29644.1 conserved hypothetical protein (DUF24) [Formosa sp. Hel1_33_131]